MALGAHRRIGHDEVAAIGIVRFDQGGDLPRVGQLDDGDVDRIAQAGVALSEEEGVGNKRTGAVPGTRLIEPGFLARN